MPKYSIETFKKIIKIFFLQNENNNLVGKE